MCYESKLHEPSWHRPMARHVLHCSCKSQLASVMARHVQQLQTSRAQLALATGATCATTPNCKSPAGISQWRDLCGNIKPHEPSWHWPTVQHVRQLQLARAPLASANGVTRATTSNSESAVGISQWRGMRGHLNCKSPVGISQWRNICDNRKLQEPS